MIMEPDSHVPDLNIIPNTIREHEIIPPQQLERGLLPRQVC